MADVARPMLAEVLSVLTGTDPDAWSFDRRSVVRVTATGATWTPPGAGWHSEETPWTITDPADAQEALVARGLLPEGWCDPARRGWWCGWWCAVCGGKGLRLGVGYYRGCYDCRQRSHRPSTIPDLVAVTSIGVPAILSAETLARESAAFDRPRSAPHLVVWRVGERETTFITPDGCTHEQAVEAARRRDALVRMGLALDAIDRDAVRIVVPPVGGGRG